MVCHEACDDSDDYMLNDSVSGFLLVVLCPVTCTVSVSCHCLSFSLLPVVLVASVVTDTVERAASSQQKSKRATATMMTLIITIMVMIIIIHIMTVVMR